MNFESVLHDDNDSFHPHACESLIARTYCIHFLERRFLEGNWGWERETGDECLFRMELQENEIILL